MLLQLDAMLRGIIFLVDMHAGRIILFIIGIA